MGECSNLLVSRDGQPLDGRQNQHAVGNADAIDGVSVDEIEIEPGIENLSYDLLAQRLVHRLIDAYI